MATSSYRRRKMLNCSGLAQGSVMSCSLIATRHEFEEFTGPMNPQQISTPLNAQSGYDGA
jgi:hypothetical protein